MLQPALASSTQNIINEITRINQTTIIEIYNSTVSYYNVSDVAYWVITTATVLQELLEKQIIRLNATAMLLNVSTIWYMLMQFIGFIGNSSGDT